MCLNNLSYSERIANYEREKSMLPRETNDYKTYEQAVKMLAKKWRI